MLVLLKVNGMADLSVPEMAPADGVHAGQWAVAVGRTFRADRTNVTVGIVSAVNRMFGKAIQTDADVSTANYGGPLVDIRGRVFGVIVPMAPRATSEVAGVEWYDSGIGFAVPLASLTDRIERMKKGEDQRSGLLGIGMQPKNPHSAPAELAAVRPGSPAGQAGLKKGDRIIELDSKPIRTQTDLRFALGTAYGGDSVRVIAMRGDERIERTIELVGELAAFRHAFLGILPMRPATDDSASDPKSATPTGDTAKKADEHSDNSGEEKRELDARPDTDRGLKSANPDQEKHQFAGIVVRMVYPNSPAASAGVQRGDRILEINETKVQSVDDAIQAMNNVAPGSKVSLQLMREAKPIDLTLSATQLPSNIPAELPSATVTEGSAETKPAATAGETIDLKLPEFPHTCKLYVPSARSSDQFFGVLLWLGSPVDSKPEEIIHDWQKCCDRDGLILIVPTPNDAEHWERTDLEYLHTLLERVVAQYKVDPHRVIAGGQGNIGAIAWPLALASRDFVRGIAAVAAPLPRQIRVPNNDPAQRLAILVGIPPKKDVAAEIAQGLKSVADEGYNVTTITTVAATAELSNAEREETARWIDTLDRF